MDRRVSRGGLARIVSQTRPAIGSTRRLAGLLLTMAFSFIQTYVTDLELIG